MSVASGEEGVRVCLGRVCGDRCRGLGLVCRCDVVWVVVGLRTSPWASWVKGLMVLFFSMRLWEKPVGGLLDEHLGLADTGDADCWAVLSAVPDAAVQQDSGGLSGREPDGGGGIC